ncbi:hypothetical protein [Pantanalinema sp. GBBB05]|uniref:hypothetical protein n=1 Tax=Pantanalinema sp. GBBB05 TaxID=2604139 RepID=UPI001D1C4D36|nr:hypothetical protein [Pantanalinema sp. GBBB05]
MAHWIKFIYDRNTYVIDLDRVTTFCLSHNRRISFPVMDGSTTIVINQQSDPATYQTLLDYIEQQTGQPLT